MPPTNISWAEKYRPQKFIEFKGQSQALEKTRAFIQNFSPTAKRAKKALILYGPPGTGKTTLAHILAKENKSELFELNASDLRNKGNLQETLKPAMQQKSLSQEKKIILVDEADGISSVDRGGLTELLRLIEETKHPIIITANDIWDQKFSSLRKKAELVQLKELDYKTIKDVLIYILRRENLFVKNDILTSISVKAKGDLRASINDLQTISKLKDPSSVLFDERNKEVDIFKALKQVFKTNPTTELLGVYDNVNMPIDEIILWVEENIPYEYEGQELFNAIEALSKTDIFKGRIYKQQYWRFLVYENILLSFGISAAKKTPKEGFTSYKRPSRILKIWLHNQKTMKKKSISSKYAKYNHIGTKRAMNEFNILKPILKNPQVQQELKLSEEEIEYLAKN
jgi:replication factor C large subunit